MADLRGNAAVDERAKETARRYRVPAAQRALISRESARLTAIARWIGQITAYANAHPSGVAAGPGGKQTLLRDSTGLPQRASTRKQPASRGRKRKAEEPAQQATVRGDLSMSARWSALKQRVLARVAASAETAQTDGPRSDALERHEVQKHDGVGQRDLQPLWA